MTDDEQPAHRHQVLVEFEQLLRAELAAAGIRPSVIDAALSELLPRAAAQLEHEHRLLPPGGAVQ